MSEATANATYHAALWHGNQFRSNAINGFKLPYITHPMEVMKLVWLWGAANEVTGPAAVLHDVVEDCNVSYEGLYSLFGLEVADVVLELTHYPEQSSKEEYIASFLDPQAKSVNALVIKIADRICNVRDFMIHPGSYAGKYMLKAKPLGEALVSREEEIIEAFGQETYDRIEYDWVNLMGFFQQEG